MRRFEEILSILSSILLGLLVTDFDKMMCGLGKYIRNSNDEQACSNGLAQAVTFMLIGMFLRNIHGAARYDEWASNGRMPTIEGTVAGRVLTFLFSMLALFAGPFLVGHGLAWHPSLTWSRTEFAATLFLPVMIYALWDLLLFFAADEPSSSLEVGDVVRRWAIIDVIALALGSGVLLWDMDLRVHGGEVSRDLIARTFLIVTGFVMLADYVWNHRFYFPALAAPQTAAIQTAQTPTGRSVGTPGGI